MLLSGVGSVRTGVALFHAGQFHGVAREFLHVFGERDYLCAVALVGWFHRQCQQMTQRVDRDKHLGSLASLGPVVACSRTTLTRGLQRAAVDAWLPGGLGIPSEWSHLDAARRSTETFHRDWRPLRDRK